MSLNRRATLSALAGTVLGAALLVQAAPAQSYTSSSVAQPGYPGSTLVMKVSGKPRSGGLVTLRVTGSNDLFPIPPDPDFPDRTPLDYTLDVYVQDRAVFSTCAPDLDAQNDRIINLPDKVKHIASILNIGPSGPFAKSVTYRAGTARRIMFCAYTRYSAADDIARASLKHDLVKRKIRRR